MNVEVKVTKKNSAINLLLASVLSSSVISWVKDTHEIYPTNGQHYIQLMGSTVPNSRDRYTQLMGSIIPNWWAALYPADGQHGTHLVDIIIPN